MKAICAMLNLTFAHTHCFGAPNSKIPSKGRADLFPLLTENTLDNNISWREF